MISSYKKFDDSKEFALDIGLASIHLQVPHIATIATQWPLFVNGKNSVSKYRHYMGLNILSRG